MDIFESFATDEAAEINGAWQKIGTGDFLIARSNNRNYARALSAAVEKHQAQMLEQGEETDKLSDELMVDIVARTILLDWKNVKYQGKALPYSRDNAVMVLKHRDFLREILKLAEGIDAYRLKAEEAQAKN